MVGAAVHEGDEWVLRNSFSMSDVSYRTYLSFRYGRHASDILKRYPAIPNSDLKTTISDLITDSVFLLSARGIADSFARSGSPVFVYLFSYVSAHNRKRHRRAAHSDQIPYFFGTVEQLDPVQQADRDLSRAMTASLANFVKTGSPNGSGIPAWPVYDLPARRYLEFGRDSTSRDRFFEEGSSVFQPWISSADQPGR